MEQRILLSQHEAAALASLGIWFELILMQLLVRHIYDKAATSGGSSFVGRIVEASLAGPTSIGGGVV